MIPIFGHEDTLAKLEVALPAVFLLQGPQSVGKRTLVLRLQEHHNIPASDFLWYEKLTMAATQEIRSFIQRKPTTKAGKLVCIRLDNSSESSQNALLKTLEEPPGKVSFALLCVSRPMETIVSRAQRFPIGLLPEKTLQTVLLKRLGMAPDLARRAAKLGRGQVARALQTDSRVHSKALVMSVLKSITDHDAISFEIATRGWDEDAHELLLVWITEAVTGNWAVYDRDDFLSLILDRSIPRRMLASMQPGIKPRLAVRSGLASFIR